jgi:hypothetical protein
MEQNRVIAAPPLLAMPRDLVSRDKVILKKK